MKNPVRFLRRVAFAEGISFLVLLAIAMPLKYLAHMPSAVMLVGWVHGILFITFCAALFQSWILAKWPVTRCAVIFVAALLPFGPFVADRRMIEWEGDYEQMMNGAANRGALAGDGEASRRICL